MENINKLINVIGIDGMQPEQLKALLTILQESGLANKSVLKATNIALQDSDTQLNENEKINITNFLESSVAINSDQGIEEFGNLPLSHVHAYVFTMLQGFFSKESVIRKIQSTEYCENSQEYILQLCTNLGMIQSPKRIILTKDQKNIIFLKGALACGMENYVEKLKEILDQSDMTLTDVELHMLCGTRTLRESSDNTRMVDGIPQPFTPHMNPDQTYIQYLQSKFDLKNVTEKEAMIDILERQFNIKVARKEKVEGIYIHNKISFGENCTAAVQRIAKNQAIAQQHLTVSMIEFNGLGKTSQELARLLFQEHQLSHNVTLQCTAIDTWMTSNPDALLKEIAKMHYNNYQHTRRMQPELHLVDCKELPRAVIHYENKEQDPKDSKSKVQNPAPKEPPKLLDQASNSEVQHNVLESNGK